MNQQPRDAIGDGRAAGRDAPAACHPVSRPELAGHALRRHGREPWFAVADIAGLPSIAV